MTRLLMGIAVFSAILMATSLNDYTQSISLWQQQRDNALRSPDGWLTLVGLFWLNPGNNTIGSADTNDFVLPKGSAPARIGTLRLENGKVTFVAPDGAAHALTGDEEKPQVVHAGSISFFIIERGGKLGVRVRDSNSPVLKNFQGMKYFPVNPALHFQAKFVPESKKIPILNILGQTEPEESPGIVEFTYQGHPYQLRPIYEGKTL